MRQPRLLRQGSRTALMFLGMALGLCSCVRLKALEMRAAMLRCNDGPTPCTMRRFEEARPRYLNLDPRDSQAVLEAIRRGVLAEGLPEVPSGEAAAMARPALLPSSTMDPPLDLALRLAFTAACVWAGESGQGRCSAQDDCLNILLGP